MLKAQLECISVEDKEENCHANLLSPGHTVTHTHTHVDAHTHRGMPQVESETVFKQEEG